MGGTSKLDVMPHKFALSNAAVGATLEDIENPRVIDGRYNKVCFELENTHATVALTDFSLMVRAHEDGTFVNLITGAGWQAAVGAILLFKTANIDTLAATAKATLLVNVAGWQAIKFQAKTGTSGSVTVRGYFSRS